MLATETDSVQRRGRWPGFAILGLVLACGAKDGAKLGDLAAMGARQQGPAAPRPATATQAGPRAQGAQRSNEGPLELELRVVRSMDGVGLRVLNAGRQALSIAPEVEIWSSQGEALHGRGRGASGLSLQTGCDTKGCVTLAPGAEIDAPCWLERQVNDRCGSLFVPPGPGSYRLVVRRCGGTQRAHVDVAWPVQ